MERRLNIQGKCMDVEICIPLLRDFFTVFIIFCVVPSGMSDFNVVHYGAIGDGITDDTQAFLKSWQAICGANDTATLLIPSKKTFLLTSLCFEGPCKSAKIHISVLGNITAPKKSMWAKNGKNKWIKFSNVDGLIVDGFGKIDGHGQDWWSKASPKNGHGVPEAPTALSFHACKNLQISGLTILNSARNHISLDNIFGAMIYNIHLTAPKTSSNTDGIDISQSTNIQIHDSIIGTGDDCIAINSGCSYINITRVTCGPGHGISIGSLGENGAHSTVEGVLVSHCNFSGTDNGVRIKTWRGGSGYAKNITFEKIGLNAVKNPIIIDQHYYDRGCNNNCSTKASNVQVTDITYQGVEGKSAKPEVINLNCSTIVPCTNIVMIDVGIECIDPRHQPYANCRNANGTSKNTSPNVPCLT